MVSFRHVDPPGSRQIHESLRCYREHRRRRAGGGPHFFVPAERCIGEYVEGLNVPQWWSSAGSVTGCLRTSSNVARRTTAPPTIADSLWRSTLRSPDINTITGDSSTMNTSDLTICATSQPMASAAATAVPCPFREDGRLHIETEIPGGRHHPEARGWKTHRTSVCRSDSRFSFRDVRSGARTRFPHSVQLPS